MPSIVLRKVSFAYQDQNPILSDVDLHLSPGATGVVGENGSGKSTLLALLSSRLRPSAGVLKLDPPSLRISVCTQTVDGLSPVIEAFAADASRLAQKLRGRLELSIDELARFETLSPGEQKRWQIGAALFEEPDVLLLDEPETFLDIEARALVRGALAPYPGICVVVSHDRAFLQATTRATVRIARGEARLWPGPYDEARAAWEAEEAYRISIREKMVSEQQKLEKQVVRAKQNHAAADAARSTRQRMKNVHDHDARGALAKGRANAAEKRAGRSVAVAVGKLERQKEAVSDMRFDKQLGGSIFFGFVEPKAPWLFRLDAETLGRGGVDVLRDVRFSIERGARIRIKGPNGSGKTTLLEALANNACIPSDRFVYLRQDMTPEERRATVQAIRALGPEEKGRTLSIAAALGLDPSNLPNLVSPSPGEARKLAIALALGRHVAALLLDEPDNHLDLPSRERLEKALEAYPGAIVMVCHDDRFASALAASEVHVRGGKVLC